MNTDSTKYFSSKQEHLVADYLGWNVVSGSGARQFRPGDIESERFLCECKTHTSPTDKIFFNKSVWDKIKNEATSKFKTPILITDNGTQKLSDTWCIVPESILFDVSLFEIDGSDIVKKQGHANLNFKNSELQTKFMHIKDTKYITFTWGTDKVALLHINALKAMLEE